MVKIQGGLGPPCPPSDARGLGFMFGLDSIYKNNHCNTLSHICLNCWLNYCCTSVSAIVLSEHLGRNPDKEVLFRLLFWPPPRLLSAWIRARAETGLSYSKKFRRRWTPGIRLVSDRTRPLQRIPVENEQGGNRIDCAHLQKLQLVFGTKQGKVWSFSNLHFETLRMCSLKITLNILLNHTNDFPRLACDLVKWSCSDRLRK